MLNTIEEALAELRAGRPVLVADDADRENEGDAILAAELADPRWVGWMVRHTSGYLCAPMTDEHADQLGLPLMWPANQDPLRTRYTVAVDAASGITTGIDAAQRARTARVLASATSTYGPAPGECWRGAVTPRPPSTSPGWPAWNPSVSLVNSWGMTVCVCVPTP